MLEGVEQVRFDATDLSTLCVPLVAGLRPGARRSRTLGANSMVMNAPVALQLDGSTHLSITSWQLFLSGPVLAVVLGAGFYVLTQSGEAPP